MKKEALAANIIDVIKEEQIKLGYRKEHIRLYYPLDSLNTLMGTVLSCEEMKTVLAAYFQERDSMFGSVEISCRGERFCIHLPERATEYVHDHTPHSGFLYDFLEVISAHGITIEDVLAQFKKYSDHVYFEKMAGEEFDYLIYFEDETPDAYRYCVTDEGHHMIYHRYTKEDYAQLMAL